MARNYRNYTDDDVITAIKNSLSIAQVLRFLGLKAVGGNYYTINKKIAQLKLDVSHFKNQGWNKDRRLKEWKDFSKPKHLKRHLLKVKGHICERCKLSNWLDFLIPLEVHHLDGNRFNNEYSNLQLLCCNCHSLTDNWRNKRNRNGRSNKETIKAV